MRGRAGAEAGFLDFFESAAGGFPLWRVTRRRSFDDGLLFGGGGGSVFFFLPSSLVVRFMVMLMLSVWSEKGLIFHESALLSFFELRVRIGSLFFFIKVGTVGTHSLHRQTRAGRG